MSHYPRERGKQYISIGVGLRIIEVGIPFVAHVLREPSVCYGVVFEAEQICYLRKGFQFYCIVELADCEWPGPVIMCVPLIRVQRGSHS